MNKMDLAKKVTINEFGINVGFIPQVRLVRPLPLKVHQVCDVIAYNAKNF